MLMQLSECNTWTRKTLDIHTVADIHRDQGWLRLFKSFIDTPVLVPPNFKKFHMYPCFFDSQALLTTPRSSYYGPSLHPYAWLRSPEKEHKWQELLKKEYCSSQMIEIVRETNLITD